MSKATFCRAIGSFAAAALALNLAACATADETAREGDGEQVVTVGTLRGQPHLFVPYFYEDYAPEGVTFEVVVFDSSPDLTTALAASDIDFAVTGVPSILSAVADGRDVRMVGASADGGMAFVGTEDIDDISDLADRTVGFPQGATQEIVLQLLLEEAGLDAEAMDLVNLSFGDMATAFASEQVDAFISAEVGPSTAIVNSGAHSIADPYVTDIGRVNIGFATRNSLIEDDSALVQQIVDVHIQATEAMASQPEEWAERAVTEFGLDPEVTAQAITNIWPHADMTEEYQTQVMALAAYMVSFSQLTSAPDEAEVFDTSFIDSSEFTD